MSSQGNFLSRLLRSFFSRNSPEYIKKKKLKRIARNISRTKFSKWYKNKELTPECAFFFFEIYKTVGPARALLENANSSNVLKFLTIETGLSNEQLKLLQSLTESAILSEQNQTDFESLELKTQQRLSRFIASFDDVQKERANQLYHQVRGFVSLSLFDYYYFLKQFDGNLKELNFINKPNFKKINAIAVLDQLHDFLEVLMNLPLDSNWQEVFKIIEKYKGIKPVNFGEWKKTYDRLRSLHNSLVLENIIKHTSENPDAKFTMLVPVADIASEYKRKVINEAEKALSIVLKSQKNRKVDILVKQVFNVQVPPSATKYYIAKNPLFADTKYKGFIYGSALSYLKSFLIEYFKTELREISNVFLVRATWENPANVKAYSESYHELLEMVDRIIEFDEELKEGEREAMKLKAAISRAQRDISAENFIRRRLNDLNKTAYVMVISSCKLLITIAKLFKLIIEDFHRPRRTLLQNWREVEQNCPKPADKWLSVAYKKIHAFVVLEQLLISQKG